MQDNSLGIKASAKSENKYQGQLGYNPVPLYNETPL